MSSWNPNSDIGEDGLPNRDKANYPFWVKSLGECLKDSSIRSITFINDKDSSLELFKNKDIFVK
jgi:hypothetical protein